MGFYDDFYSGLNSFIGEGRRFKNNNQMAKFCDVTPAQMSLYTSGKRKIHLQSIGKILDRLGAKLYFPTEKNLTVKSQIIELNRYVDLDTQDTNPYNEPVCPLVAREVIQKYINDSIPHKFKDYSDLAVKADVSPKVLCSFMTNKTMSMDLVSTWNLIIALDLELVPRDKSADKATGDVGVYRELALAYKKLASQYEADKSRLVQVNGDLRNKLKGMKPRADKIVADHGEDAEEVISFMHEFDALYVMGQRGENLAVAPETNTHQ
jgi:hypothetical protein